MLRKGHGIDNTRFHRLIGFGCCHGCGHTANSRKCLAKTACGPHAHAFKVSEGRPRIASADDVILRHGRSHKQTRIPLRHLFCRCWVSIDCMADRDFFFKICNA